MSNAQPPQGEPTANQPVFPAPPPSTPEALASSIGAPSPAYFTSPAPPASPPPPSWLRVLGRMPPRSLVAGGCAAVTLLSFFLLPFFEYFPDAMTGPNDLIACTQGYPYGIGLEWSSGAQIAGDTEFNVYRLSAPPLLWILPAAAGIALLTALILMSGTSGGRRVRAGSLLTFVSGIAGIASLVWLFVGLQAFIAVDAPQHNFSDTATLPGLSGIPASCLQGSYMYGIGFWLSLVGMLGLIAASVPVFSRLFGKVGAWLRSPACCSSSAGNRLVLLVQCLPDSLEARVEEGKAR